MSLPTVSFLPPGVLMFAFYRFQLRLVRSHHSEQAPSFPTRMESGENGFVNDHRGPGPKRPDEHRFDGQVTVWPKKDAHHLVRLIVPPTIRHAQRSFPELADGENK